MGRRPLLAAAGLLLAGPPVRAQSGLWPEWIGSYDGAASFSSGSAVLYRAAMILFGRPSSE